MKHLILIVILTLTFVKVEADSTDHSHVHGVHFSIINSREVNVDTINESFNVKYKIYFTDTTGMFSIY
jgi:hypothetical protein